MAVFSPYVRNSQYPCGGLPVSSCTKLVLPLIAATPFRVQFPYPFVGSLEKTQDRPDHRVLGLFVHMLFTSNELSCLFDPPWATRFSTRQAFPFGCRPRPRWLHGYSSSLESEVRRQRWTQPSDSRGLACQSPNVGVTSKSHTRPEPSKTPPIGRQPDNTLLAKACRDLHSMSAMDSSSEPPRKLQSFSFDIVTRYNTESILRSYACNFRQCQEDR